ncbi:MAG: endolytic transglycosylase MltG [Candidatus Peribacteraceae bacterium]|nr:endolytic transglycosylase MltG [Candidatus Peribacteraceae bacterium]
MKKIFRLLVLLLIGFLAFIVWYLGALRPVDASNQARVLLKIEPGTSVAAIVQQLEEKDLIRSASAFMLYAKFHGAERELQAGSFVLRKSFSAEEIISTLRTGKAEEMTLTIPEGYTVSDIDALLAEKGLIEGGEIIACAQTCDFSSFEFLPSPDGLAQRGGKLEGYLYPDTYFVDAQEFVPKFFLERLLTTFRKKVLEELAADREESPRSLHEIVTMASLIEAETRGDTENERLIVSGILWKRFDAGSGLGVDATVRYILQKPTDAITVQDLNTDSPYNTRKFRGLPPGPIANPGYSSIFAALNPQESDYWYYLHDKSGVIRYARTNEEHNVNKYQYLR